MPGRALISTVSVLVFLAAWEMAPRLHLVDGNFTSRPSLVVAAGRNVVRDTAFVHDLSISLQEFGAGFALAIAVGVPLGLLLGAFPVARYLVDPLLMAIYSTPYLALLPILVVWLGIGMGSKIAAVFAGGVIPIVVNSMAGVREVDASCILAARSFCAGKLDVFVKVMLPASLPAVMMGIRLGLSRAVLGVVVAEMYVSQAGVGSQIMRFGSAFRIDYLLFYVLLVSIFGFAATRAVRLLEQRLWTTEK